MVKHYNAHETDVKGRKVVRNQLYRKKQADRVNDLPRLQRENNHMDVRVQRMHAKLGLSDPVALYRFAPDPRVTEMFTEAAEKREEEISLIRQLNDVANVALYGDTPACVKARKTLRNQAYRRRKRADACEALALRAQNVFLRAQVSILRDQLGESPLPALRATSAATSHRRPPRTAGTPPSTRKPLSWSVLLVANLSRSSSTRSVWVYHQHWRRATQRLMYLILLYQVRCLWLHPRSCAK